MADTWNVPDRLQALIEQHGEVLHEANILNIDPVLNHRVRVPLIVEIGAWIAERFRGLNPDLVLTAESSGISPALMAALALNVDLVYARKQHKVTMRDKQLYVEHAVSPTKGGMVNFYVSSDVLPVGQRVLIVDDFLASGLTLRALLRLVYAAQSTPVGIGAVVEKSFQGGRQFLTRNYPQVPIESVVSVRAMTMAGTILFD